MCGSVCVFFFVRPRSAKKIVRFCACRAEKESDMYVRILQHSYDSDTSHYGGFNISYYVEYVCLVVFRVVRCLQCLFGVFHFGCNRKLFFCVCVSVLKFKGNPKMCQNEPQHKNANDTQSSGVHIRFIHDKPFGAAGLCAQMYVRSCVIYGCIIALYYEPVS